jgi:nucleotidyltransferase/DNA polymerase involved in DNA repair
VTTRTLNALALRAVMRRAVRNGDMDALVIATARHVVEVASLDEAEMHDYIRRTQRLVEDERAQVRA